MKNHSLEIIVHYKFQNTFPDSRQRIFGIGDLPLQTRSKIHLLNGVLHVPTLYRHLLFVSRLTNIGIHLRFEDQVCYLLKYGLVLGKAIRRHNLYENKIIDGLVHALTVIRHPDGDLWHGRFCHTSLPILLDIKRRRAVEGFSIDPQVVLAPCEACVLGKPCRRPFNHIGPRASLILELVHMDLCGPLPQSLGCAIYFLLIIYDHSRNCFFICLKRK